MARTLTTLVGQTRESQELIPSPWIVKLSVPGVQRREATKYSSLRHLTFVHCMMGTVLMTRKA